VVFVAVVVAVVEVVARVADAVVAGLTVDVKLTVVL